MRACAIGCRRQAFGCPCPTACHSRPCVCHGKRFGPSCQRIEGTKGAHPAGRIGAFQNTTGVLPGDRFGPSSCKQRGRERARTFGACRGANKRRPNSFAHTTSSTWIVPWNGGGGFWSNVLFGLLSSEHPERALCAWPPAGGQGYVCARWGVGKGPGGDRERWVRGKDGRSDPGGFPSEVLR